MQKIDWVMVGCAFLLVVMGLLSLWSSSFHKGDFLDFHKQLFFLGIAIVLMVMFSFFDWRALKQDQYLVLALYFFVCLPWAYYLLLPLKSAALSTGIKSANFRLIQPNLPK